MRGSAHRTRLLVVDDDERHRELVRGLADHLEMTVVAEAEDGSAACEEAVIHRPDVVVMDWQMPVLDGVAATDLIVRSLPSTVVIANTSSDGADVRRAFAEAGAAGFVRKGDLAALEDALTTLVPG